MEKIIFKKDIDYLLMFIRYFFKTGPRPMFNADILLKNQSFLNLLENLNFDIIGFIYPLFLTYPEFNNSSLAEKLKPYYEFFLKKEEENLKIIKILTDLAFQKNIEITILKEYNYKLDSRYKMGSRFSNDVDILISQKDVFRMDGYLRDRGFLLNLVDFTYHLQFFDPNEGPFKIFELETKGGFWSRKREIVRGVSDKRYRNFNYLFSSKNGNSLLEVHFTPNKKEGDETFFLLEHRKEYKPHFYKITPEARIIYDAHHFIEHLTHLEIAGENIIGYLGHLKRLCDLAYNINFEDINWDLLEGLAKENQKVTQLYYYLALGKKWLKLPIPDKVLNNLRRHSRYFPLFFLKSLRYYNIFANRITVGTRISAWVLKNSILKQKIEIKLTEKKNFTLREKLFVLEIVKNFFRLSSKKLEFRNLNREGISALINLIKETSTDGIAYYVLKDIPETPDFLLDQLKKRIKILLLSERFQKEALRKIKEIPIPQILLKESIYRFYDKDYIPGSRWAADIDIYVDKAHLDNFDELLKNEKFYADGGELAVDEHLRTKAYLINKDIAMLPIFRQELVSLIEKAKFSYGQYKASQFLKKMEKLNNLIKGNVSLLQKTFYSDEVVKKYFNLLLNEIKFLNKCLKMNWLTRKKISHSLIDSNTLLNVEEAIKLRSQEEVSLQKNLQHILTSPFNEKLHKAIIDYHLSRHEFLQFSGFIRDSLNVFMNRKKIIDRSIWFGERPQYYFLNGAFIDIHSHFLFSNSLPFRAEIENFALEHIDKNLYALKNEDSVIVDACHFCKNLSKNFCFHGFLKYLTDIFYKFRKDFNWKRVIILAKKTNASSQVYFYLYLAKKYLNAPIPLEILKELKNNGSRVQNFLLERIDGLKLLFNEPTFFVKLYSKMYIQKGFLYYLVGKIHAFYNKIFLNYE